MPPSDLPSMPLHRLRPTYAGVVGTLALFLSLGGTAWAASTMLAKNSVGSEQIVNGSITAADVHAHAIGGGQLANGAVGGAQLKAGSVTGAKIAKGSLSASNFATGQLPTGATGAAGPVGPSGPAGALSDAYETAASTAVFTTPTVLATLSLPAGNWLASAHVAGVHTDTASYGRLECSLIDSASTTTDDFAKLRVGPNTGNNPLIFTDQHLQGVLALPQGGTVRVTCTPVPEGSATTSFQLDGGNLIATRVGAITRQ